jgi:nucleotide-binding universal stress UspA family protein
VRDRVLREYRDASPGQVPMQARAFGPTIRLVKERTKTMFETIVWATDGSELADAVVPYVRELARIHGSRIVAVHANELLSARYGGAPLHADEPDVREKIARQVEELREAGFEANLEIRSGSHDVVTLIARAADDVDADLIVVATHGHGAVHAVVMGSVARALCHAAHRPLLVVPSAAKLQPTKGEGARATAA